MPPLPTAILLIPAFAGALYLIRGQVKRRGLEAQVCRLTVLAAIALSVLLAALSFQDARHYHKLFFSSLPMTAVTLALLAFNRTNAGQERIMRVLLPIMIGGLTCLSYLTALVWARI